ncbi:hypothetical protein CHARACLAT_025239 [Characodon lateralis]|uniref:Immunoglobulin V-set domain-containing protein n=1 Tax=Characodon lateralis TaxID=208331 RepID=A0ABU7DJL2_9TELE|nr:hypothetical protein [Characodon lateralis]
MELLVLVSLCILTFTGKSFGDETGLVKIKTDELNSGNASITIKQAKVSDSGTYICFFYEQGNVLPSGHVEIKLTVEGLK